MTGIPDLMLEGAAGLLVLIVALVLFFAILYIVGCVVIFPLANLPSVPLNYKYGTLSWKGEIIEGKDGNELPPLMYEHGKIAWMWIGVAGFTATVLLLLAGIGWIINAVGVDLL